MEVAHALHGDRAFQGPRPDPGLQARARPGHKISRGPDLRRELDRAELRPLLPAHGMRRSTAAPGMGAELPGARHDLRDCTRRAEQGNPRSCRAVSGFEIAHRSGKAWRDVFRAALPSQPLLLAMDPARPFAVATPARPKTRLWPDQRAAFRASLGIWYGLAFRPASPVRCQRK